MQAKTTQVWEGAAGFRRLLHCLSARSEQNPTSFRSVRKSIDCRFEGLDSKPCRGVSNAALQRKANLEPCELHGQPSSNRSLRTVLQTVP